MAFEWRDATSVDYWTVSYGSWGGSSWSSGDFAGFQFVVLTPGSWATGYAPGKIRLTYTLSSLTLIMVGTLGNATGVVNSGGEIDISAIGDITVLQFGGTATPFVVSKIEIYGESLSGEDESEDEPTAAVAGTAETWSLRYRPGRTRGRKHSPLKTGKHS